MQKEAKHPNSAPLCFPLSCPLSPHSSSQHRQCGPQQVSLLPRVPWIASCVPFPAGHQHSPALHPAWGFHGSCCPLEASSCSVAPEPRPYFEEAGKSQPGTGNPQGVREVKRVALLLPMASLIDWIPRAQPEPTWMAMGYKRKDLRGGVVLLSP